jgi:putative DNA primase/helicase
MSEQHLSIEEEPELILVDTPRLRDVELGEFLTMTFPPREYVMEPIIPAKGLAMLFASRGIGKTYISLGIGCAVAAGAAFLAWKAPKPRKVLYVDGEMPTELMQHRCAEIVAGMDIDTPAPDYFRLISGDMQDNAIPSLSTPEGQSLIEEKLDDAELLILDNVSCLINEGRENDVESWLSMQDWLLSLRRRGKSVLVDHHANATGERQRGTSKREDVLDTVLQLRHPADYHEEEGLRCEVHLTKARGIFGKAAAPFETQLRTVNNIGLWTIRKLEDVRLARASELFGAGMSVRDVAEELGVSKTTAGRLKAKLAAGIHS